MTEKKEDFQIWKTLEPGVFLHNGEKICLPENWIFVPSGDSGLTRRLKASGECYVQVHRRKNRIESQGLWTDGARVPLIQKALQRERENPAYQMKLESARKAREEKQESYVLAFRQAVLDFLAFAPRYQALAGDLADAVTEHAVPVGSGSVARTERIPIEQRAGAAVIAWMRHQTTAYDHMTIARIRGERREVRHHLAERSRELLQRYRRGDDVDSLRCPLVKALKYREQKQKKEE